MTIDQLKYFITVATYQHVGRAALAASISRSVISATISSLEDELQLQLFLRKGRRIILTQDGKELMNKARDIVTSIENIKSDITGQKTELKGHYRLGASHFLSSRVLSKKWFELQKKHKFITSEIYSMNTAQAISDVASGRLDLAICFSPLQHQNLKILKINIGELVLVVRKNHPILKKSLKTQINFLSTSKSVFHKIAQGVESCETHPVFDKLGCQPNVGVHFDSDEIAVEAVSTTDSWALLPDIVLKFNKSKLAQIPFPRGVEKPQYDISILIHKDRANEPVLMEFIKSTDC